MDQRRKQELHFGQYHFCKKHSKTQILQQKPRNQAWGRKVNELSIILKENRYIYASVRNCLVILLDWLIPRENKVLTGRLSDSDSCVQFLVSILQIPTCSESSCEAIPSLYFKTSWHLKTVSCHRSVWKILQGLGLVQVTERRP